MRDAIRSNGMILAGGIGKSICNINCARAYVTLTKEGKYVQ